MGRLSKTLDGIIENNGLETIGGGGGGGGGGGIENNGLSQERLMVVVSRSLGVISVDKIEGEGRLSIGPRIICWNPLEIMGTMARRLRQIRSADWWTGIASARSLDKGMCSLGMFVHAFIIWNTICFDHAYTLLSGAL